MTDHIVAYTESPAPVLRLFKKLREAMDDPERVEVGVTDTEIRFQPASEEGEGLRVTPSTGDVSATGVVSEHDLEIEEGRYAAVCVEENVWAIDFGDGQPDPVGGRDGFEDELRDALEEGNSGDTFTVDEIRVNRTEVHYQELLESLLEEDSRNSAVEAYEKQLTDLRADEMD